MNSNLNSSAISGFSALLYYSFIIRKKYRVDSVAKEMQIATDTLYRYVRGENIMPPDRIVDLIRATGDDERALSVLWRRPFPKTRSWQTFCSPKCRKQAWTISKRTNAYSDIRVDITEIKRAIARIEAHLGIKEST